MSGLFAYTARSANGDLVAGTLLAPSRIDALDALRSRSLTVTSVATSKGLTGAAASLLSIQFAPRSAQLAMMFRCLAAMVGAGVSLSSAIQTLREQCESRALREAIDGVGTDLEAGLPLSDALSRRPREFPSIASAIVRAGEVSGSLDDALATLATVVERSHAVRSSMAAALAYPAIVILTALGLVVFIVSTLLPALSGMLSGFGVQLPWYTRDLITVGTLLRTPIFWIGFGVAALGCAAVPYAAGQNQRFADFVDRCKWRLPVLGGLNALTENVLCAQSLGALLAAGIAFDAALSVVELGCSSPRMSAALGRARACVELGQPLADTFATDPHWERTLVAFVRAGERAGNVGEMFLRWSEFASRELEAAVATVGRVLEPALMIVLGGFVGIIVAAVLVPLYSIVGSIR